MEIANYFKRFFRFVFRLFIVFLTVHTLFVIVDGLTDEKEKSDLIVIFGNKVHENGKPSLLLERRLNKGFELFDEGYAPFVMVSGGVGKEGHDEAEVMKDYLMVLGIPGEAIIVDSKGINTRATTKNIDKEKFESVIVVTDFFHISRAKLAIAQAGFEARGVKSKLFIQWKLPYSLLREFAGYYAYAIEYK